MTDSELNLTLLGSTQLIVRAANHPARTILTSGKPLALLTFLHASPAQSASREQLLELLWSDADQDAGRHTLRQTLWYVRRKLLVDPFTSTRDGIRLTAAISSDRATFLAALEASDHETALNTYGGDFFPDFAAPGGAGFEHWADIERSRLRALFVAAATRVVRDRLGKGHARDAMSIARRAHDLAPRHQGAWRLLLESCLAADDLISASVELERLDRWLHDEELEPDAATAQLMKLARSGVSSSKATLASNDNPNTTAARPDEPESRTLHAELVGREAEFSVLLAAVEGARRNQSRHIHISALPGHGKTRLLDGFAARLRSTKLRVVSVRATPAERSLPYAFAAQLVSLLVPLRGASAVSPDSARALVALAPVSSSYLNAEADRSSGDDALRRRSLAVTELVLTIAHDAPLIVLVDDVHWMDGQSRMILASLATRLGSSPVMLVTAGRSTDRFVEETPSAQTLFLNPLTPESIGALVMSIGRLPAEPWTETLIQDLHAATGGSPLLVLESLQLVMEREQLRLRDGEWSLIDASSLAATLDSGRALQQRLAGLPAAARNALLRVSVAGLAVDDDALPHILAADGVASLAVLESRGLLVRSEGSWRVAHDEITSTIVEMSTDEDRKRANDDWAAYLERGSNADVSSLLRAAWHRARAGNAVALDRVFARAIRSAHLAGEERATRELAHEVLGVSATSENVHQLVKRLPWRLRHRTSRWATAAAFAASLAVVVAAVTYNRSSTPIPSIRSLMVADLTVGDSPVFIALPDVIDELSSSAPIDLAEVPAPISKLVHDSVWISGQLPDSTYVGSIVYPNKPTQGMDVVRVNKRGEIEPLLTANHDQATPTISPDGKQFLFSNGEWHSKQRADIGLYDVASKRVTRVTASDDRETGFVWSIDGSKIGVARIPSRDTVATICQSSSDGSDLDCRQLPNEWIPTGAVGWRSADELLVVAESVESSRPFLVAYNFRTHTTEFLDNTGSGYSVHPNGRLVLCRCRVDGYPDPVMAVFSPYSPSIKRPLRFRDVIVTAFSTRFFVWNSSTVGLTSLRIKGPSTISLLQAQRFQLVGFDDRGRQTSVPSATWTSLDTSVALIEGAGVVRGRREGIVRIVASVSSMVTDTFKLAVRQLEMHTVSVETWRSVLQQSWATFGDPAPRIENGLLRLIGDSHLKSGIVSRRAIDMSRGGGMRATVRLPLTVSQWQNLGIHLSFFASDDSIQALARRDAQDPPDAWHVLSDDRSCSLYTPRNEGGPFKRLSSFVTAQTYATMPRSMPFLGDGAWHTVVLQLFDDGRCAVAVDNRAIAISESVLKLDLPLRVAFDGQSMGTAIEIRDVESWSGVRGDIDWLALSRTKNASPTPLSSYR